MRLLVGLALAAASFLSGSPAAAIAPGDRGPSLETIFSEPYPAELAEAVEEIRAFMLQPGEHVEGWDRGGLDPEADLRAAGAESHFFLILAGSSSGVGILTARPVEDFLPEDWVPVGSFGAGTEPGRETYWDILPFSRRLVMVGRTDEWRENDAFCARGMPDTRIYDRIGGPLSEEDEERIAMLAIALIAVRDETICTRFDDDGGEGYDLRYFFPDGRLMPALNTEPNRHIIVPMAPIDHLVVFGD